MNNYQESLKSLLTLSGALCAAVVDYESGMMLDSVGSGVDLEIAAAGNTEVMRSKMRTMEMLKSDDEIEDILITLGKQYHLLRPIKEEKGLFLYFALDRRLANLALARRMLLQIEKKS